MKGKKGRIFIVSAPSGAGKTTLCKRLIETMPGMEFSVSYTSRSPRQGERDGIDYYFITEDSFRKMAGDGEFAEWANVHGNYYGTAKKTLCFMVEKGSDVLLDIDVQGAAQMRSSGIDAVYIFILPPSMGVLKDRLIKRNDMRDGEIQPRLNAARDEIRSYFRYDYVILNDELEKAMSELSAIIISCGLLANAIDPDWVNENFLKED